MDNLRENLLTYIGYCLKNDGHLFDYQKCSKVFKELEISHHLSTLHKEFSLLKKEGLIDFKTYYHKPFPVLTQKGRLNIRTRLPFRQYGQWDNHWRLITFDLPQKERSHRLKLIHKLQELNFAELQPNVYISPYPLSSVIISLTRDWGIRQYLKFFEVASSPDEKGFATTWNLDQIGEFYTNFTKIKIEPQEKYWPLIAKKLERDFAKNYGLDPHLPKEFLPAGWQGEEAYKKFKEISNSY